MNDEPTGHDAGSPIAAHDANVPAGARDGIRAVIAPDASEPPDRSWMGATLVVFVAAMVVLSILEPNRTFSANENRTLASLPQLTASSLADGSFGRGLQSYVADHIVARDGWISLKLTEDRTRGVTESNDVYLGTDNYLIEKPTTPDAAKVQRNLDAINAFAAQHANLNIVMTVAPNASCVLASHLPANAPVRDQRADLAMLAAGLGGDVHWVDVTDTLLAHVSEQIYYRTDHHWTSLGASYAFATMAGQLGIDNPATGYDIHTVSDTFEGTMASKSGDHDVTDTIETYTPQTHADGSPVDVDYYVVYEDTQEKVGSLYKSTALTTKDQYAVFFGGNYAQVTVRTTNANGRRLLVLKDSYANCFIQFLVPYYQEIVIVDPRYFYENLSTTIANEKVTDVLLLYNLDTYLGDTSLADVLATATS